MNRKIWTPMGFICPESHNIVFVIGIYHTIVLVNGNQLQFFEWTRDSLCIFTLMSAHKEDSAQLKRNPSLKDVVLRLLVLAFRSGMGLWINHC
jgi:hypothetical protein